MTKKEAIGYLVLLGVTSILFVCCMVFAVSCTTVKTGFAKCARPTVIKGMKDREKCEHGARDERCNETAVEVECTGMEW